MKLNLLLFIILCFAFPAFNISAQTRRPGTKPKTTNPAKTSPTETEGKILEANQTLAGHRTMQVIVEIKGTYDINESDLKSDLETKLTKNGITVLPYNPGLKQPTLKLTVSVFSANIQYIVYSMDITFSQFFPIKSSAKASTDYIKGTTWKSGYYGIMGALVSPSLRRVADTELTNDFIAEWSKANSIAK